VDLDLKQWARLALQVLTDVEWSSWDADRTYRMCPYCGARKGGKHEKRCNLGLLISPHRQIGD